MKITNRNNKQTKNTQLATPTYTPVRSMFDDFFSVPTIFDEVLNRSIMPNYSTLSADVWEEGDSFFIKMALPGVSKKDVNIEIDGDAVRIKGEGKVEEEKKEDKGKKYYFRSLDTSFEQAFTLPSIVDADKAEAEFKDGVLTVKLPKAEEYKPKKVEVK